MAASLEAAKSLEQDGISARVINIHTIKPIDEELLVKAAKETGKIVTVEEHSIIGGLGRSCLRGAGRAGAVPVKRLGIRDEFGESGVAEELLHKHGLDGEGIYKAVKAWLGK